MKSLNRLLEVPTTDPEDARRRKLLNILLSGVFVLVILGLALTPGAATNSQEFTTLIITDIALAVSVVVIFAINRYGSGTLASMLFLLLLTVAITFSDTPAEVANGRTLFAFSIPIIMGSVLLRPYFSFVVAIIAGLIIAGLALNLGILPNLPAMIGFLGIALVSWLSARSLEDALHELRAINRELDQRVAQRTQELSAALQREQIELSKNQAILAGIADGVVVFDNDGVAILLNPAASSLLQRPSEDVLGQPIQALLDSKVKVEDREKITTLIHDRNLRPASLKLEWGVKTLSASFAPVREATGQRMGVVAVFRDFTREAQIDRMKSSFVSIASHELRTPLNAIIGYTEILASGAYGPLSEKQRGAVDRLMTNSGQLLSLVNNLLDQAQIEAGTLKLQTTLFAPDELLDDVQGVMDVLAQNKGLKLSMQVEPEVPALLYGDSQRLRQIIVNLLSNAIKFTERGSVEVRVFCPNRERWALSITDTGPGIPIDAQAYIFDPFRRVDTSVTREQAGVGLGLSIVKQLVTLMNGEIQLESRVGRGSTFTVVLPIISEPEKQEELQ